MGGLLMVAGALPRSEMSGSSVFLASLFNVTGVAIVVVVSVYVQHRFPRDWFKYWTWSFGTGLVSLSAEALAMGVGRSLPLTVVEVVAIVATIVFQWQTILAFIGRRFPAVWARATIGLLVLVGTGALLVGSPVAAVLALPMVIFSVDFMVLGAVMIRRSAPTPVQTWLGIPLIALGLLPITYPFNHGTSTFWIGFYVGGMLNLMVGIGMIVAAMENSARELQLANEQLKLHDRLKTNIFNNVSHEIRTPLTAIRAAAAAAEKGELASGEFSALIGDQVTRLDRMLSDILDVAQLEVGSLHYEYDECDLGEIVEAACRVYQPLFKEGGKTLACHLPDEPLDITCDRHRLMQVLTNLLENARKFTPKGGNVTVTATATPGGFRVMVADDGPGVPMELREAIFEKFFQADGSSTRRSGGAGLGLTISRAIIEQGHGGRIWAERREGPGATFVFELPAKARPNTLPIHGLQATRPGG